MGSGKLYEDALKLSVNKNLVDIKTLLGWAEKAHTIAEKEQHIKQAIQLLTEISENLSQLKR
jgi:predicted RNase H-like HicB family nuclease